MINFIQEWKSVSNDTVAIASAIGDEILKHSKNVKKQYGNIGNIPFKEGEFYEDAKGLLGNMEKLKVEYTIYYCENSCEYNFLSSHNNLNCEADYEDEYIIIKMAYINDVLKNDFIDSVQHEINHLLQYSKGFKKTKRFDTLYKSIVKILQDVKLSSIYKIPAWLMYYTFRHEEDSFIAQYYSYLKRNFTKLREIDVQGGFDKTIKNFEPYRNIMDLGDKYNRYVENNDVKSCIEQMNINVESFEMRIEKGLRRLRRKLFHAYERHIIELGRSYTIDNIVRKDMRIVEKYGWEIKQNIESDYRIKGIDY